MDNAGIFIISKAQESYTLGFIETLLTSRSAFTEPRTRRKVIDVRKSWIGPTLCEAARSWYPQLYRDAFTPSATLHRLLYSDTYKRWSPMFANAVMEYATENPLKDDRGLWNIRTR
ncbi:hypothetical protein GQ600_15515 [Phytophthora cactorum]|nr:hypothetical protein GQ600_15515 [Phytophthora cactorum]